MNILTPGRAGPPSLPALLGPDDDGQYHCDCPGFKQSYVERMCLRCLSIYVEGLPHVLTGRKLKREMVRAAVRFAAILKDEDPSIRNLKVNDAIRATEASRR